MLPRQDVVQLVFDDVAARRGQALLALELLVAEGHRRVRQATVVEAGRLGQQGARGQCRRDVVLADEAAAHMAGADAQGQHRGHVAGLGQAEGLLDHLHHHCQVGPRVQQQHRRLQRVGVGAFLDDGSAVAVVLADNDERTTDDAGRRQVGQGVRRDIGADDGLPGHRAAQRVVDGRTQHGRCGGFVGAGLHVHAEFIDIGLGLHHHVQQVRDG